MVTDGNPFFNNCNINNNSEIVPLFNDVTELINSISCSLPFFLRLDLMIEEIIKNPITTDIIIVSSTIVKY